jgi:hypothetical protein
MFMNHVGTDRNVAERRGTPTGATTVNRTARCTTAALLCVVAAACGSDRATDPAGWTCKTPRPALQGTWVGTLDNAEIVLRLEERCALGFGTFASDRWSIRGSWSWRERQDQLTGDVLTGTLASEFGATSNFSYLLSLISGSEGGVFLRVDDLPAASAITAHVSGAWRLPPSPMPGPIVLQRR